MSNTINKPVALTAALLGGLALSTSAFAMSDLAGGYLLGAQEAGAQKDAEGKCGEGKCGGHTMDAMDTDGNGSISQAEFAAAHDGKADRFATYDANSDGMIDTAELDAAHADKGGAKADMEGKCGEGKCGGSK